jgi:hypothetical protein
MSEPLFGSNDGNGYYGFNSDDYNKRMTARAQQARFTELAKTDPAAYALFDPKADYFSGKAEANYRKNHPAYAAKQDALTKETELLTQTALATQNHEEKRARFRTLHELDPKKYPSGTFDPKKDYMAGADLEFYKKHKAEHLNPDGFKNYGRQRRGTKSLSVQHSRGDHNATQATTGAHHPEGKHGQKHNNQHQHHGASDRIGNSLAHAAHAVKSLLHLGR